MTPDDLLKREGLRKAKMVSVGPTDWMCGCSHCQAYRLDPNNKRKHGPRRSWKREKKTRQWA